MSKVAMRSSGATKLAPPVSVLPRTKSMMACLAVPSFHDGSGILGGAVCRAQKERQSGDDLSHVIATNRNGLNTVSSYWTLVP